MTKIPNSILLFLLPVHNVHTSSNHKCLRKKTHPSSLTVGDWFGGNSCPCGGLLTYPHNVEQTKRIYKFGATFKFIQHQQKVINKISCLRENGIMMSKFHASQVIFSYGCVIHFSSAPFQYNPSHLTCMTGPIVCWGLGAVYFTGMFWVFVPALGGWFLIILHYIAD